MVYFLRQGTHSAWVPYTRILVQLSIVSTSMSNSCMRRVHALTCQTPVRTSNGICRRRERSKRMVTCLAILWSYLIYRHDTSKDHRHHLISPTV